MAGGKRSYDYAWVMSEAKRLSNWGRWGKEDEIGSFNQITPEKIVEAAGLVRKGKVFSLSLPFDLNGPNDGRFPGRLNPMHFMTLTGTDIACGAQDHFGNGRFTDDWVCMNLSCATQWDGLPHVMVGDRMYNDVPASAVTASGATKNSVDKLKDKIVSRGVLLDIPLLRGVEWLDPGEAVEPEDLDSACRRFGVEVGQGDIVLVRTGQLKMCRSQGSWGDYGGGPSPGLGVATAGWLAEHDVAAVAADTWGFEAFPYQVPDATAPLHQIILTHCGIFIGEMFDMEGLAEDCRQDGVYEFMLVAPVLPVTGAVNTPVNPQAIK